MGQPVVAKRAEPRSLTAGPGLKPFIAGSYLISSPPPERKEVSTPVQCTSPANVNGTKLLQVNMHERTAASPV
jgi:hypothetical protein